MIPKGNGFFKDFNKCFKNQPQRDDLSDQLLLGTTSLSGSNENCSTRELGENGSKNLDSIENFSDPQELNFFLEDGSVQRQVVEQNLRAIDLCHLLALKCNISHQSCTWTLVEQLIALGIERRLEEHEEVVQVFRDWAMGDAKCQNKFIFREDFRKYEFFQSPQQFFPLEMIDLPPSKTFCVSESPDLAKIITLQNILNSGVEPPPIQGYMHFQENGKDSWDKKFFNINGSTLHGPSSSGFKPVSFELENYNIYCPIDTREESSPKFRFCLLKKLTVVGLTASNLIWFYVDSEKLRQCWVATLRLAKFGNKLRENYKELKTRFSEGASTIPPRKTSNPDYTPMKTLVAMDFTGNCGKVVEDENEARAISATETHSWRRKMSSMKSSPSLTYGNGTQSLSQSPVSKVPFEFGVHSLQPWFYSDLTRAEATNLLKKYGTVDGVFLVRISQRRLGGFVLDYIYHNNVQHAEIIPVEERQQLCYSLDEGLTKFYDLIQLVEFYQLNLGSLPVKLTHFLVHRSRSKETAK